MEVRYVVYNTLTQYLVSTNTFTNFNAARDLASDSGSGCIVMELHGPERTLRHNGPRDSCDT